MNPASEQPSSRRRFLKQSIAGFFLLSIGGVHALAQQRVTSAPFSPADLVFFTVHEYQIVQAVARRIIGPSCPIGNGSGEIDVALRADRFLSLADPEVQEQIHQLLVVFNSVFFTFLFDLRLSSSLGMSGKDQDTYLQDWMTSPLAFRRTAFQALKRLCASMYYTDHHSWQEIEYVGMFLPEDRP